LLNFFHRWLIDDGQVQRKAEQSKPQESVFEFTGRNFPEKADPDKKSNELFDASLSSRRFFWHH